MVEVIAEPALRIAGKEWKVTDPGVVRWRGLLLILLPGNVTDLASVPRSVRWLVDDDEPGLRLAAMLHDAAYRKWPFFANRPLNRREADLLLFEVAVARGLPRWKARLVWLAARLFGRKYWRPETDDGMAERIVFQR